MSKEREKELARKRAKRYRDGKKANGNLEIRGLTLEPVEQQKLDKICQFFAYPAEPYTHVEALQSMIHRLHAELPAIQEELGVCSKCGEQLPQGCTNLAKGGLFKGDAMCWHTTQRVRLYLPQEPKH